MVLWHLAEDADVEGKGLTQSFTVRAGQSQDHLFPDPPEQGVPLFPASLSFKSGVCPSPTPGSTTTGCFASLSPLLRPPTLPPGGRTLGTPAVKYTNTHNPGYKTDEGDFSSRKSLPCYFFGKRLSGVLGMM